MSRAYSPHEFASSTERRSTMAMDTSPVDSGHQMELQRELIDLTTELERLGQASDERDSECMAPGGDDGELARELVKRLERCSSSDPGMQKLLDEARSHAEYMERALSGEVEPQDYGFDEWPSERDIAIATWNLQGSDSGGAPSADKLERLVQLVLDNKVDLVHLQELTIRGGNGPDEFLAQAAEMLRKAGAGDYRYASLISKREPFSMAPAMQEGATQGPSVQIMPEGSADAYGWLYNGAALQMSGPPQLLEYEHDSNTRESFTRTQGSSRRRSTVLDSDRARRDLTQRPPALAEFDSEFASFSSANWHAPHNGQGDAHGETPSARSAMQMYGESSSFASSSAQQHIVAGDLNVASGTASLLGGGGVHSGLDHIVSSTGPVHGHGISVPESDHDPVVGKTTIYPNRL